MSVTTGHLEIEENEIRDEILNHDDRLITVAGPVDLNGNAGRSFKRHLDK